VKSTTLSSSTSGSSFVTSNPSQPASAVSTTQVPTSTSSSQSHGISTESKVGLGVGIPFGVAAIVGMGLIAYFLRRRGQARSLSERVELVPSQPYGFNQHSSQTPYDAEFALPPPPKNRHESEDRRATIRHELPAGNQSPRELHTPSK
jgi:hypothetical protein